MEQSDKRRWEQNIFYLQPLRHASREPQTLTAFVFGNLAACHLPFTHGEKRRLSIIYFTTTEKTMKITAEKLRAALASAVLYRNIISDGPLFRLTELLDLCDMHTGYDALKTERYCSFVSALYTAGCDLGEYLFLLPQPRPCKSRTSRWWLRTAYWGAY